MEPTPDLSVRPRVYVVLRNPRLGRGGFYKSFGSFKLAVGRLSHDTVCHGFPTEGECRVYCRAAGVDFPPEEP